MLKAAAQALATPPNYLSQNTTYGPFPGRFKKMLPLDPEGWQSIVADSSLRRSSRNYADIPYEIVNIHKLAKILSTSTSTLRKGWRRLPHFYVGEGCNLKSARFDVKKVINFLEEEAEARRNNGTIQAQRQEEGMVRPLHAGRGNFQKRGVSNEVRSGGMGRKRALSEKAPGRSDTKDDAFDLCAGIK
jgi:hypothetical protein